MNDELVRLRLPPASLPANGTPPNGGDDFDAYLLARRDALAEELRAVEQICLRRGTITRLLCAPGRNR